VALLKRATRLLDRALESLDAVAPPTAPEVDVLIPLRHATGPVIARRLAEWLGLSRAGVSKTLAKLERRGFNARTPNPADRHVALVTGAGVRAVDTLFPRRPAAEVALPGGLGEAREWVVKALGRLVEALETGTSLG
jgi:DNA-binding MarR family transcriptional regulator